MLTPRATNAVDFENLVQLFQPVLESAQREFVHGDPEAAETLRRSLNAVSRAGAEGGNDWLLAFAEGPANEADEELRLRARRLLAVFEEMLRDRRSGEAILIVEDDAMTIACLRAIVKRGGNEILVAGTVEQAEAFLRDVRPDLVLLDLELPDADGRQMLSRLKSEAETASIPVIVLSGKSLPYVQAECRALGADDVLAKPVDPELLRTTIARRLGAARNHAQAAGVDSLTGLPNRASFTREFARAKALSEREGTPLSIAIIDLDRFKSVNDLYGHAVGDRVLCRFAEALRSGLRQSDLAARWGGEEFVVLAPNTDSEGLVKALEGIRDQLLHVRVSPGNGHAPFRIRFSAGVADVEAGDGLASVMVKTDEFLYMAKSSGRGKTWHAKLGQDAAGPQVLVADDDDLTATILASALEGAGCVVHHESDGVSALSFARDQLPAAIVLDVRMPGKSGVEVLSELRRSPETAAIPVLILSGLGDERDVLRGFQAGADDYLLKPFSPAECSVRLQRLLNRR
jgi:diguanylate cyclase (GGDEF)-like protein